MMCVCSPAGGEVYAWGTNSMGQCGQGHNNGSITTPSKVHGLDGIQVQQISAGTSHSIVWTAMPMNRWGTVGYQSSTCLVVQVLNGVMYSVHIVVVVVPDTGGTRCMVECPQCLGLQLFCSLLPSGSIAPPP